MIYKFDLWVFILLFNSFIAFSQNQATIDSLQSLLQTDIPQKKQIDIYNEIASEYGSNDTSKVAQLTSKALSLSQEINYSKGIVDAQYNQSWVLLQTGFYKKAQVLSEKALALAQQINYAKGKAMSLRNLGILNNYQGNYSKALEYYQQSLNAFQRAKDDIGIAYGYSNIGIIYKNQGNYPRALENYEQALKIFEEIRDLRGLGYLYNNFGVIYKNQENYVEALKYFQKSLTAFEEVYDTQGLVYVYNNFGNIYKKQANYEEARVYYEKSLAIKEQIGDKRGMAKTLSNLGDIYTSESNYPKALNSYEQSIQLSLEIDDKSGVGKLHSKLGKLALNQENYDEAKSHFENAIEIKEELGEKPAIARAYVNLGITYHFQNNTTQALKYLKEGNELAGQLGKLDVVIRASEYLAQIYEGRGDYKQAYENHVVLKEISDSVFNEENVVKFTQLVERHTFDKVQDSIHLMQSQERALLNADIKQRHTIQIATFIGLGLAFCILIILVIFYRSKQRSNVELSEANEEINTINNSLQSTLRTVKNQRDKIVDSINYAQNIQSAVLPLDSNIQSILQDYFILFRPRDVVSGDFYWVEQVRQKQFIVVADCTGHGVPGAFMTMLGMLVLNDVIIQKEIHSPDEILNNLDALLRKLLKSASTQVSDGMDIGVCVIDKEQQEMSFAGAKNSLIMIKDGELMEIKGNLREINGMRRKKNEKSFTAHHFTLEEGTTIYLYSDGYQDQFGGMHHKKFMKKRFKKLLTQISEKEMTTQKQVLGETLDDWMKDDNQVDDVLVMGIRV